MRAPLLFSFAVVLALAVPGAALAASSVPAAAADEPKIEGYVIKRGDGRFLGVEVEGVRLKITFYGADKKKEAPDVVRITARWTDNKPRLAVLLPSGPATMVSPPLLNRPFNYVVRIALVGADEQVAETYAFNPREADKAGG